MRKKLWTNIFFSDTDDDPPMCQITAAEDELQEDLMSYFFSVALDIGGWYRQPHRLPDTLKYIWN